MVEVEHLVRHYPAGRGRVVHAIEDVSFLVRRGECFGIIGESGSGKTTLGRCMLRLVEPTRGSVRIIGVELTSLSGRELRKFRQHSHIVFQEPLLSMNPLLSIGYQITDPLRVHRGASRAQRRDRARELLGLVGLPANFVDALPSALSGGELQRCAIARSLAAGPDLIVLDEPTSALPPATRVEIVQLLKRLQAELDLTYVLISHDLAVVRAMCDRVAVMYLGSLLETGSVDDIFDRPAHPYTRALLTSTLEPDPAARETASAGRERLDGEIPSAIDLPTGCLLASRCRHAVETCHVTAQTLQPYGPGHQTACWRVVAGELDSAAAPPAASARSVGPRVPAAQADSRAEGPATDSGDLAADDADTELRN